MRWKPFGKQYCTDCKAYTAKKFKDDSHFIYHDSRGEDVALPVKVSYLKCLCGLVQVVSSAEKFKKTCDKAKKRYEKFLFPNPKRSRGELIRYYAFASIWSSLNVWLRLYLHSPHPYRVFFEVFGIMIAMNEGMDYFILRKRRILRAVNARLDR